MLFESGRDKNAFYMEKDNVCLAHFHRSTELMYVLSGEKIAYVNGEKYVVKKGDLLVCPPYSIHVFPPSKESKQIVITVLTEAFTRYEEALSRLKSDSLCIHDTDGFYLPLFLQLNNPFNEVHYEGLTSCILGLLLKDGEFINKQLKRDRSIAEKIAAHIDENYDKDVSLKGLADKFGYSPNYFSWLFNNIFHTNISNYVNYVRVKKSVKFLKTHKISAVYALCGFHSPQQYYLNFKKVYGCSPKKWILK